MDSFAGFLRQFHIMLQWANDGIQLAIPPQATLQSKLLYRTFPAV